MSEDKEVNKRGPREDPDARMTRNKLYNICDDQVRRYNVGDTMYKHMGIFSRETETTEQKQMEILGESPR